MTTVTNTTPRTPTFYRQTAKETIAIAQASTDLKGLADRLAFVNKRMETFAQANKSSKVQRWTRVAKVISDRITFLSGQATVAQAPKAKAVGARAGMTFVGAPTGKKSGKAKAQSLDIDAILKATGLTAQDLLLKLAERV